MAGEDRARLLWTKQQPCCAPGAPSDCMGVIEAHHAGRHGVGQKCPDAEAIPLCVRHHRAWHDHREPFTSITQGSWPADARRAWANRRIAETQDRWLTETFADPEF